MGFEPTTLRVLDHALTSELLRTRWRARVILRTASRSHTPSGAQTFSVSSYG